jgi:Rv0623-like transcription factor
LSKLASKYSYTCRSQDGDLPISGIAVRDRIHIRNAEAADLARRLARHAGRMITAVVLDALRQYHSDHHGPNMRGRVDYWRQLLRDDRRRRLEKVETPVAALYDDTC